MKLKKAVALFSLLAILIPGLYTAVWTYENAAPTYHDTDTDMAELLEDPEGVAEIIVKTNLEKTNAINDVASIVFDYRGYDTLGESFILLTAIAGSFVILSGSPKDKKEGGEKA